MTDELLPCPFCGCISLWVHLDEYDAAVVECNQCDGVGPRVNFAEVSDPEARKQMAIAMWNTRKNPINGLVYATGRWTENERSRKVDDLIHDLELLRLEHYDNDEDQWYSCPMSGNCLDDRQGDECNCGAGRYNAILDGIIERIKQWTK